MHKKPCGLFNNTVSIRVSEYKDIRDLYRGITEFKKVYQVRTNLVKDERVIYLQILTTFCIGGRITSVSH
jgi:hypothetical protein